MTAKEYLNQIKKIDNIIENKKAEIEQLRNFAMGTTTSNECERVQGSSNHQKMAEAVARYIDIEKELDEEVISLMSKKRGVIKTLEMLDNDEYDVLYKTYIQYKSFKEIAYSLKKTYRWVVCKHSQALKNVQILINDI